MPDTPANQAAYPQSRSQKPGLGFPIARVVALLSLASGAVLDLAIGRYAGKNTGETALFRQLWHSLFRGDVVGGIGTLPPIGIWPCLRCAVWTASTDNINCV
jgi:hypothetical protein